MAGNLYSRLSDLVDQGVITLEQRDQLLVKYPKGPLVFTKKIWSVMVLPIILALFIFLYWFSVQFYLDYMGFLWQQPYFTAVFCLMVIAIAMGVGALVYFLAYSKTYYQVLRILGCQDDEHSYYVTQFVIFAYLSVKLIMYSPDVWRFLPLMIFSGVVIFLRLITKKSLKLTESLATYGILGLIPFSVGKLFSLMVHFVELLVWVALLILAMTAGWKSVLVVALLLVLAMVAPTLKKLINKLMGDCVPMKEQNPRVVVVMQALGEVNELAAPNSSALILISVMLCLFFNKCMEEDYVIAKSYDIVTSHEQLYANLIPIEELVEGAHYPRPTEEEWAAMELPELVMTKAKVQALDEIEREPGVNPSTIVLSIYEHTRLQQMLIEVAKKNDPNPERINYAIMDFKYSGENHTYYAQGNYKDKQEQEHIVEVWADADERWLDLYPTKATYDGEVVTIEGLTGA